MLHSEGSLLSATIYNTDLASFSEPYKIYKNTLWAERIGSQRSNLW